MEHIIAFWQIYKMHYNFFLASLNAPLHFKIVFIIIIIIFSCNAVTCILLTKDIFKHINIDLACAIFCRGGGGGVRFFPFIIMKTFRAKRAKVLCVFCVCTVHGWVHRTARSPVYNTRAMDKTCCIRHVQWRHWRKFARILLIESKLWEKNYH